MRFKKIEKDAFLKTLISAGLVDRKNRVRWNAQNFKAIFKASGLSLNSFAFTVGIQNHAIKCWLDGSTQPTIMLLSRIREKTGVIFTFGSIKAYYPCTVQGLADAMAHRGFTQIELSIQAKTDKMTINRFLNNNGGIKTGLTAQIWDNMAIAMRVTFYVPPLNDMDFIIASQVEVGVDKHKKSREEGIRRYKESLDD